MSMLQESRAIGMAALRLPHALRRRGCGTVHYVAERNDRYPVLLVHGYAATECVWTPLRRALVQAGFGHIVSLNYNSFAADPVAVSADLTDQALRTPAARPRAPPPHRPAPTGAFGGARARTYPPRAPPPPPGPRPGPAADRGAAGGAPPCPRPGPPRPSRPCPPRPSM